MPISKNSLRKNVETSPINSPRASSFDDRAFTETSIEDSKLEPIPFSISIKRSVHWNGGVTHAALFGVTEEIKKHLEDDRLAPIHLLVTSYGGGTGIAMSFYDTMRRVFHAEIVSIGSGDVDSSGIIIFLTGNRRLLTPNTTLLLHLAGRTFEHLKRLTTPEMESIVKEDKLKDFQYASVISDRSSGKLSVQEVLDMMANNTVLTATEAVDCGIAHEII